MGKGLQRQRHGVTKHLVEGVGGLIVGAALTVLLTNQLERPARSKPSRLATATEGSRGETERQV